MKINTVRPTATFTIEFDTSEFSALIFVLDQWKKQHKREDITGYTDLVTSRILPILEVQIKRWPSGSFSLKVNETTCVL